MMNETPLIAFPDQDIDPKKKNKDWILQYAKAAYSNWQISMPTESIFLAKAARYDEIRSYAMGRQSIDKHKKELLPEDPNDESYTKISWAPRTDGMVIRNIAVAKTQKGGYNMVATPVSEEARDAQDKLYIEKRNKILLRQAIQQNAPELSTHPAVRKQAGEPETVTDLDVDFEFNPKFIRSKDVEEGIDLVFSESEASKVFDKAAEDFVDFGVGVVQTLLNEENKVMLRHVYPGKFACSFTQMPDFSDISWAFEVHSTKLSDLAKKLDDVAVEDIYNKVRSVNDNPNNLGQNSIENNGYDLFKAQVMHLRFLSWNKTVMEVTSDENGNLKKTSKAKPSAAYVDKDGELIQKKRTNSEYIPKTIEVVYECKWVIGTDYIYDFGLAANIPRDVSIATMGKTHLGYHIHAASFHNMRAVGLTEALIPIIDDLNNTVFKLRMFKNRLVPNGFDIDLTAIEKVALGGGGEVLSVKEVLAMFFETGVLLSRRSGIGNDNNQNYKAINTIQNGMGEQLVALAQDLENNKKALSDISGLNELTDGSTPNPKTLVPVANLANESTNNALYYIINAHTKLIEAAAKGVVKNLQIALIDGPYDGFNEKTGRWVNIPDSIRDYDYSIKLEDETTQEQKEWLYELVKEDMANGLLNTPDVVTIVNTYNVKEAQIALCRKIEQNKQAQLQADIQKQTAVSQANAQAAQAAEAAKLMADRERHQMKMEEIELQSAWNFLIMGERVGQQEREAQLKAGADLLKSGIAPMPGSQQAQQQTQLNPASLGMQPDQAQPDQAQPDQAQPDQAQPDDAQPDQSQPDLNQPQS